MDNYILKRVSIIVFLLLLRVNLSGQQFTEVPGLSLYGLNASYTAWGDYDNDGDKDLILTGSTSGTIFTRVYSNDGNDVFTLQPITLAAVNNGSSQWFDFNNDNKIDIIQVGALGGGYSPVGKIYKNNGSGIISELTTANVQGAFYSAAPFGDFNNDGKTDLLVSGIVQYPNTPLTKLYRNNGNETLTEISANFPAATYSTAAWADYDNDGDLDLILAGKSSDQINSFTRIYRNEGNNVFSEQTSIVLKDIIQGSISWGDYNNDGLLDILLSGSNGAYPNTTYITVIYKNTGNNNFEEQTSISLKGIYNGNSAWGDYDNDGYLDIVVAGAITYPSPVTIAKLYRNNGNNSFTEQSDVVLPGVTYGSVRFVDYDGDNDLDIFINGYTGSAYTAKLFRNNCSVTKSKPAPPANLESVVSDNNVTLKWSGVRNPVPPVKQVSYNLRVGKQSHGGEIISPVSEDNGYRLITALGNVQLDTVYPLYNLKKGTYYWSVQSVDNRFVGGEFSDERTFVISASIQASSVYAEIIKDNSALIKLTRGNGDRIVVFAREGAASAALPEDFVTYTASGDLGSGTQIGSTGWFCVFNGTADSIRIKNLLPARSYMVEAFEYEGTNGNELYYKESTPGNVYTFSTGYFSEQTTVTLSSTYKGSSMWGDFDADGDLDILLTGATNESSVSPVTKIYVNSGTPSYGLTALTPFSATAVQNSTSAWCDFDRDGDLDFLVSGKTSSNPVTEIYQNNSGTFVKLTGFTLTGISESTAAWCDFDNDGDYDVLIAGQDLNGSRITKIYRNDGSSLFTEQLGLPAPGVMNGKIAWADYNNDNYPDFCIIGQTQTGNIAQIYRNNGNGLFSFQSNISLNGVCNGTVIWGDYDGDGFTDLFIAGSNSTSATSSGSSVLYRNNGNNTFSQVTSANFASLFGPVACWIDFDNDGDLDILLTGYKSVTSSYESRLYRNNGNGTFTDLDNSSVAAVREGTITAGDYDNDGDMDLLVSGYSKGIILTRLYKNMSSVSNTKPSAPASLSDSISPAGMKLKWEKPADNNTPSASLTYNLRAGTAPGSDNIVVPQSLTSGLRQLTDLGNSYAGTSHILKVKPGTYYWSVQAIDNGYSGSDFSDEITTIVPEFQADNLTAEILSQEALLLRWDRGNGDRCIVFCKQGTDGSTLASPVNNTSYLADNTPGNGSQIGTSGWYCVYNGRADSIILEGLSISSSYRVHVIEYTGTLGSEFYFTASAQSNPGIFETSLITEQKGIVLTKSTYRSYFVDINKDNFIDVFTIGDGTTKSYKNEGNNAFTEIAGTLLPSYWYGPDAGWGDYDNDGDWDLFFEGYTGNYKSILFENNIAGAFTEVPGISSSILQVVRGTVGWTDYNNDGKLDIMVTGLSISGTTRLYRNNGDKTFSFQNSVFTGVVSSSFAWGDYDNDGDLDLILTGTTSSGPVTKIYRNLGSDNFEEQNGIILTQVQTGSVAWGDYDNDGYLDLLLTGMSGTVPVSKLYRNNGNSTFTEQNSLNLPGVFYSSVIWCDIENDGFLDIILTGASGNEIDKQPIAKVYHNNGDNTFNEYSSQPFPGIYNGSIRCADYENDGDYDFLITGTSSTGVINSIYRNNLIMKAGVFQVNPTPPAPSNLMSEVGPGGVTMHWDRVQDDPGNKSLSYNVVVLSSTNDTLVSPLSLPDGSHSVAQYGNAQLNNFFILKNLPEGTYSWKVQVVDHSFKGGQWSAENTFIIKNTQAFFSAETVCQGSPTHFTDQSVASKGIASWQWDFNDGTTSDVQNPDHTFSSSGTFNVKLTITDTEGTEDFLVQDVTVKPKPATGFEAPPVCQGTATAFTNTTINNGLTVSSWFWDFGDGQSSILQQPSAHGYLGAAEYSVELKALASNGCRDSITQTVIVASYPVAAVTADAPLTFCKGDSVTLSVPYNNEYLYTWKLNGTAVSGADSSRFVAKLTGSYTAEVVNSNGNCKTTSSATAITANDAPSPPSILTSGGTTLCQGDSVVLSVTNTTGYTYQWRLNGGSVGVDSNIYIARTSGSYDLVVTNSTGCKTTSVSPVPVVVNPLPTLSIISVKGKEKLCSGENATLSVPSNANYSYSWKKGTNPLDLTTNSIVASESGEYTVDISLAGCKITTDPVKIEVVEKPSKPAIDTSLYDKNMCLEDKPLNISVDDVVAGYEYKWYRNGTPFSTATSLEIIEEGTYYLEAVYDICISQRDSAVIDFREALPKPRIDYRGPAVWLLSTTSQASQYKWFLNGIAIPGAESSSYMAGQNYGLYRLAIADDKGCFSFSDTLRIPTGITGIDDTDPFNDVKIYPNPTTGTFTIEMNNNVFGELIIDIFAQNGSKVINIKFDKTTEHFQSQIDLSGQSKGMYILNLSLDKFRAVRKVLVE